MGGQSGAEQGAQEIDVVRSVTTMIAVAIVVFFNLKTKYQGELVQVLI